VGDVVTTEPAAGTRLGIGEEEQRQLLHALDFWWFYLGYAGFPARPVFFAVGTMTLLGLLVGWWAWRAAGREEPPGLAA
jgi:hypothetical protein